MVAAVETRRSGNNNSNTVKYYIAANSTARHGNNTDLDSHADTCVAGSNFVQVGETYDTCTVYGFDGLKTKDVRIGSACGLAHP